MRRICCQSSGSYWVGFRLSFSGSIRITVRSISTTRSRNCWRNCWLSSPSHGLGIPMITHWQNPRTHQWCVSILAMRIFRNTAPAWLIPSVPTISILTSTVCVRRDHLKISNKLHYPQIFFTRITNVITHAATKTYRSLAGK